MPSTARRAVQHVVAARDSRVRSTATESGNRPRRRCRLSLGAESRQSSRGPERFQVATRRAEAAPMFSRQERRAISLRTRGRRLQHMNASLAPSLSPMPGRRPTASEAPANRVFRLCPDRSLTFHPALRISVLGPAWSGRGHPRAAGQLALV